MNQIHNIEALVVVHPHCLLRMAQRCNMGPIASPEASFWSNSREGYGGVKDDNQNWAICWLSDIGCGRR